MEFFGPQKYLDLFFLFSYVHFLFGFVLLILFHASHENEAAYSLLSWMSSQLPFTTVSTVLEIIYRVELHHPLQWSQLLCEDVRSHLFHSLLLQGKISELGLWTLAGCSFSGTSFEELNSWRRNGGISLRSSCLPFSGTENIALPGESGVIKDSVFSICCVQGRTSIPLVSVVWKKRLPTSQLCSPET